MLSSRSSSTRIAYIVTIAQSTIQAGSCTCPRPPPPRPPWLEQDEAAEAANALSTPSDSWLAPSTELPKMGLKTYGQGCAGGGASRRDSVPPSFLPVLIGHAHALQALVLLRLMLLPRPLTSLAGTPRLPSSVGASNSPLAYEAHAHVRHPCVLYCGMRLSQNCDCVHRYLPGP